MIFCDKPKPSRSAAPINAFRQQLFGYTPNLLTMPATYFVSGHFLRRILEMKNVSMPSFHKPLCQKALIGTGVPAMSVVVMNRSISST